MLCLAHGAFSCIRNQILEGDDMPAAKQLAEMARRASPPPGCSSLCMGATFAMSNPTAISSSTAPSSRSQKNRRSQEFCRTVFFFFLNQRDLKMLRKDLTYNHIYVKRTRALMIFKPCWKSAHVFSGTASLGRLSHHNRSGGKAPLQTLNILPCLCLGVSVYLDRLWAYLSGPITEGP